MGKPIYGMIWDSDHTIALVVSTTFGRSRVEGWLSAPTCFTWLYIHLPIEAQTYSGATPENIGYLACGVS